MHRIQPTNFYTKGRHEDTQDAFGVLLVRCIESMRQHNELDRTLTGDLLDTIRYHRHFIESCRSNHEALVIWMDYVYISLQEKKLVSVDELEKGQRLINELSHCRESLVSY